MQAVPCVSNENKAGTKGTIATHVFDHTDSLGHTTHLSYEVLCCLCQYNAAGCLKH